MLEEFGDVSAVMWALMGVGFVSACHLLWTGFMAYAHRADKEQLRAHVATLSQDVQSAAMRRDIPGGTKTWMSTLDHLGATARTLEGRVAKLELAMPSLGTLTDLKLEIVTLRRTVHSAEAALQALSQKAGAVTEGEHKDLLSRVAAGEAQLLQLGADHAAVAQKVHRAAKAAKPRASTKAAGKKPASRAAAKKPARTKLPKP